MDTQTSLNNIDLERRIRKGAVEVVRQFVQYPHIKPPEVTLYSSNGDFDSMVLENFRVALLRELDGRSLSIPVVVRDKEQGYSIDLSAFLRLRYIDAA